METCCNGFCNETYYRKLLLQYFPIVSAKLDNQNIGPYRVARVFPKNPLVVQLDLPESLEIHPVFHVSLLQHEADDPLPGQHQDPREPVVASDGAKELYVNRILNSKYDRRFKPPLLRYFVDWEGDHPSWEPFYLLTNCQAALDNYHTGNPTADGPHIVPCQILDCQCGNSSRSSA